MIDHISHTSEEQRLALTCWSNAYTRCLSKLEARGAERTLGYGLRHLVILITAQPEGSGQPALRA